MCGGPTAQCYDTVVCTVWSCAQPSQSLAVLQRALDDGLFAPTRTAEAEAVLELGGMRAATAQVSSMLVLLRQVRRLANRPLCVTSVLDAFAAQARALLWVLELKRRTDASLPSVLRLGSEHHEAQTAAAVRLSASPRSVRLPQSC